jgi:exopolysaccharide biosynthesis predicted pyruvyltransferase EpsI
MLLLLFLVLIIIVIVISCKCKKRNYFTSTDFASVNEIDLSKFLLKYKNKHIVYIPNPGNAGDALIAYGLFTIFDKLELDYEIGSLKNKYDNEILFYSGGGNLVGLYNDCKEFIQENMENNEIVILPHTIKDENNLIKSLGDNVVILCRERKSYNYVLNLLKNKSNVFLSKDTALYINPAKYKKNGYGTLNCFREDREKTDLILPEDNIDLSNKLNIRDLSTKENVNTITNTVFEYLSKYDTINTNRLHMAVAGSLLNKNVNMYPNNYFKNEAVYEYSLKNYPKTIFHKF